MQIVTQTSKDRTESSGGGICGTNNGYLVNDGNTGNITGISTAGGVTAFSDQSIIARCYSAGSVTAPDYFGRYPAGGVAQLLGRGYSISYSCFETGTAQVGATVWNHGTLNGIVPIKKQDFRKIDTLDAIFHSKAHFAYASSDSFYPIPIGVFTTKTDAPALTQSDNTIVAPEMSGVLYFYTTDGSDPISRVAKNSKSLKLTLKQGETLKVFASKKGFYDSNVVMFSLNK